MPNYEILNLSLMDVGLISLLRYGEISMTIKADVLLDNSLFMEAELHASHVDIYYPDWDGHLQYVADLMLIDSNPIAITTNENNGMLENNNCNILMEELTLTDGGGQQKLECITPNNNEFSTNTNNTSTTTTIAPSHFTLPRRQSIYKHDNILTIQNVAPKTYLNGLKDAINNRGVLNVGASAVLQIKTSNLPLTVELVCDHDLNLLSFPIRVSKGNCVLENVVAGWGDLKERGTNLRRDIMKRFAKTGSIFKSGGRNIDISQQRYLEWI